MRYLLLPLFLALLILAAPARGDWRSDADARIGQHRKADVTVRVVDAQGRPVPDAEVELTHRRHAFAFGTVATAAYLGITEDEFRGMPAEMRGHRLWSDIGTWENVERYRGIIEDNYTEVVFENAMKKEPWAIIHGRSSGETDAAWRGAWNVAALRWCRDRGIAVRGHVGTWCWNMDSRFSNFTEEAGDDWPLHHLLWREHLATQNAFYGDAIAEWDVLNHPVTVPQKSLLTQPGGFAFYRDQLVLSQQTAPHADRYTNEHLVLAGGHELERYEKLITDLVAADAPLDGIGFQAHFNWTNGDLRKRPTMDVVYERLERFAAFGVKMKLTELDVTSIEPDRAKREAEQAAYLAGLVRVAYSHPGVVGAVQWGLWEPRHGKAALLNADFSERPSFAAICDLKNNWRGEAGEAVVRARTDGSGTLSLRIFEGVYAVSVGGVLREIGVDDAGQHVELRLPGDGDADAG